MADVATFRVVFPEFSIQVTDAQVTYWLNVATSTLSATRIFPNTDLAIMLFAAHNLTLGLADAALALQGDAPGVVFAPLSSEGAGGLSAGFDNGLTATEGAGIYNGTGYGQRLMAILKAASLGGFFGKRDVTLIPTFGPFAGRAW